MRRIKILSAMFLLILISIAPAGNAGEDRLHVNLLREAEITTSLVRLGDIAELEGPEEYLETARDLKLDTFHDLEREKEISSRLIELHLRNAGIDSDNLMITGEESVDISVRSRKLSGESMLAEVEKEVEKYFEEKRRKSSGDYPQELNTSVDFLEGDGVSILIPDGDVDIVLGRNNFRNGGRVSQPLEIHVDGEKWKRMHIQLFIEHEFTAHVLQEDVDGDDKAISAEMVEETITAERLPSGLVYDTEDRIVRDGVFRRGFEEGSALAYDMLELPVLIDHGDIVTARFNKNNVEIHVEVRARDSGHSGDIITVENKNSGERIEAEVLNESMVEIKY